MFVDPRLVWLNDGFGMSFEFRSKSLFLGVEAGLLGRQPRMFLANLIDCGFVTLSRRFQLVKTALSGFQIRRTRSRFLGRIKEAFDNKPKLTNLLLDKFFRQAIKDCQRSWRNVVAVAAKKGIPTPAFSTALNFYDAYRSERLPANLLQAQRDYFGAHTYERLDQPRGQFFHTNWTGRGGQVSSSSYNA